jgi:protein TonB
MAPENATTYSFRRVSAVAMAISILLHATVALALLPGPASRQERFTQRAIEFTLDVPTPPTERSALPTGERAAQKRPPGSIELVESALAPGPPDTATAQPVPSDPHIAPVLPSSEPPPDVTAMDFGTSPPTPLPLPQTTLERVLLPMEAPPPVAGRELARTPPPATARSPNTQDQVQAPPPQQSIRQAAARQAAQQNAAEPSAQLRLGEPSPVTRAAAAYSDQRAQQDYVLQVVRRLSQSRFHSQSREPSERGVVVTRLTVARDGRLIDLALVKGSGFPGLDQSVLEAVRKAQPFPRLPAEFASNSFTFIVPINYAQER